MRRVLHTIALALLAAGTAVAQPQTETLSGNAGQIWQGTQAGENAGQYLDLGAVSAGDSRSDLIIGAPGSASVAGTVYVIYGGPVRSGELTLANADAIISSSTVNNQFGQSTAAGNVITAEGSQTRNLIVGAPGAFGGKGAVYVFLGGFGPNARLTTANAVYTIIGRTGDQLGTALATADLDNDGFREIIIGAKGTGRMYVIKGGASLSGSRDLGASASPLPAPDLEVAGTGIGGVLAAGDVTSDGISDLLVGSPDLNVVYLYKGRASGGIPTTPDGAFGGVAAGDRAGSSIRLLDIDHDGIRDVMIGAPLNDGPGGARANAGAVYLLWGNSALASRSLAQADVTFYGASAGLALGTQIAAGDINRDTPSDIVMMAPGTSGSAGELDIYYGRSVRTQYGVDGGGGLRVVDFADQTQIDRKIVGDPALGPIAAAQVFEVTGEGARDIIAGVPTQDASAGAVYFTISPSLSLSTTAVTIVANRDSANVSPQITISNRSVLATTWSATSASPWLSGSPASGTSTSTTQGIVQAVANTAGMAPGAYGGLLNVASTSKHLEMTIPVTVSLFVTDTLIAMDQPGNGATVSLPFNVSGWAIDRAATSGTGVNGVSVFLTRNDGSGAAPIFVGNAAYGLPRSDIGSIYGSQFMSSGYSLSVGGVPPGPYHVQAYAHHTATNSYTALATSDVTVTSSGALWIDAPAEGAVVTSAFEVAGWAVDPAAATGTGVDGVQFWMFPSDGLASPVFLGTGSYGWQRDDVAANFGARFRDSGYHFTVTGMMPGAYMLAVYAHSTATNGYSVVKTVHLTVNATALMSIDVPAPESTVSSGVFLFGGWAIDRSAPSGTGVDTVHVYAYPNPGSGQPAIFVGIATVGGSRPDVAGVYGSRYTNSGYAVTIDTAASGLAPGVYNLVAWAHSTATGTFNNDAVVRIRIQ